MTAPPPPPRTDGTFPEPTGGAPARHLGFPTGVGLVAANMIGAGVFLSAGFMVQDLRPAEVLLAWVVGALLALAGSRAYAAVAAMLPRSGGEYLYIGTLVHPFPGVLAGWTSVLVGFSAPIAIDALALGAFARTLVPSLDPLWVALAVIAAFTAAHASGLRWSTAVQNGFVGLKLLLVFGFAAVGLLAGSATWPAWTPPNAGPGFPVGPFASSLFYVSFAFSGWNAAVYASEEFRDPRRDVPRAMLVGCALVGALYLMVNWVFVANLVPQQAIAVARYEGDRVTLGHLVMSNLLGETGGRVMSAVILLVFASAISAMMLVGPRVQAAMARHGHLPALLAGRPDRPPALAICVQGGLAALIALVVGLQHVLQGLGALLTLFSALVVVGMLRAARTGTRAPRPGPFAVACGVVFLVGSAWTFWYGFRDQPVLLAWVGGAVAVAAVPWFGPRLVRRLRDRGRPPG